MVILSDSISSYLCRKIFYCDDRKEFSKEELDNVKRISLSKNDIESLAYFSNLEELYLDIFPSVNDEDLKRISNLCPNIKVLKVQEQNAIWKLDLRNFSRLESLEVIHNDNLNDIVGMGKLKSFTFYDNKEYDNIKQLVDNLMFDGNAINKIDITYYVYIVRRLVELGKSKELLNSFRWIESVGIRDFKVTEYGIEEVEELFTMLSDIVYKYTFVTDGESEKYGVLYQWMLDNVSFVNEDENVMENVSNFDTVNKVFSYMVGGRLTYAKAFQLLLTVAGVNTKLVYSVGADESIGYYDGKKIYSLLGNSDYALLRVMLDGKIYYCDIAWDCMIKNFIFADSLRMFLISKDELQRRQKFIGEGNIVKSYSYHGDDADDLIMYAKDRIVEVDGVFDEIEKNDSMLLGAQLNYSFVDSELKVSRERLKKYNIESEGYRDISLSIKTSEDLLNNYLEDIHKYEKNNKMILSKYEKFIKDKYYGVDEQQDIDMRLVSYEISEYIYGIISEYIKTA